MKCYNCGPGTPKDDDEKIFCPRCSELYEFSDGRMMVRKGMRVDITAREARLTRSALRQRPGDQPLPIANRHPSMHDLVIEDVLARKQLGLSRYGSLLQPFNGRSFMLDAYQELHDLLVYLRGKLWEEEHARMKPEPGTTDQWLFTDVDGKQWRLTESKVPSHPFTYERA